MTDPYFQDNPEENFTFYDYVYPNHIDKPVRLGDSGIQAYYTNKYNKFYLPFKISKIISYRTGDDIDGTSLEEILFDNDDISDEL